MTLPAARIAASGKWMRRLILCLAGASGALAVPPFGLFPCMVLAMTVALWSVDAVMAEPRLLRRLIAAAGNGWWFGFGYFVAGLWWLGAAFLVEADQFAWALPLGVLGLPAGLAIFTAFSFALAALLWRPDALRVLTFAGSIAAGEYLRGNLLSGFPWNSYGMALGGHVITAQLASVTGLYGLTLVTVAIAAAPATLTPLAAEVGADDHASPLRRALPSALAALALAGIALFGALRIPPSPAPLAPDVKIRIVQPMITQDTNVFNWDNRERILNEYIRLTEDASGRPLAASGVTHVIWPESAFPFLLAHTPEALSAIGHMLPQGALLITGAARAEAPAPGARPSIFFNSMQVVDHSGRILGHYDKSHLVPFGEYLPLAGALDALGIRQFVQIPGGFTAGKPGGGLPVPGLPPVLPLICYEAIFPGFGATRGSTGVIINVTNDGWFGDTPGPLQHLAQARLRAIELGLPLIRAANTGISAVVDPWGRLTAMLPLETAGILDSGLPVSIPSTIYAERGDFIFALLLLFFMSWRLSLSGAGRPADQTDGQMTPPETNGEQGPQPH